MLKPLQFIYTIWLWIVATTAFTSHMLFSHFIAIFFKDREWGYIWATKPFLKIGFFLLGIRINYKGLENLKKGTPFIIMANHQSLIDIIVIMVKSPVKINFIAKEELLKVPVLGWDIRSQGHLTINRSRPREAMYELEKIGAQLIADNKNLLFYPEGTRSVDGHIQSFKRGGFMIAVKAGVPIVPCYIKGTGDIINKKRFLVKPGKVTVCFGEPIPIPLLTDPDAQKVQARELQHKVRNAVLSLARKEGYSLE